MGSFSHFKSTENEKIIGKSSWRINHQEIYLVCINIWGGMDDEVRHLLKIHFIWQCDSPRRDQVGDSGIACCLDCLGFRHCPPTQAAAQGEQRRGVSA